MKVWRSFAIDGIWYMVEMHEFVNKLVEWEAFIDPVRIEFTQLELGRFAHTKAVKESTVFLL